MKNIIFGLLRYRRKWTFLIGSSGFIEAYKYKYNGQEYESGNGLNMTEMDFRQYDNAVGRFNVIDPLAEMDYSGSPYAFGFNDPVYFSDPSGLRGRNPGKGILNFLFGWLTGDRFVGYGTDYGGGRSNSD